MKNTHPLSSHSSQHGLALLEALVSILIFSFAVLGIVGLQGTMIKDTTDAQYRTQAASIAQKRLGEIWVGQENLAMFSEENTDISASSGLPNGKRTTIRGGGSCAGDLSCFVVTVTWQSPGSDVTHNVTLVDWIAGGTPL